MPMITTHNDLHTEYIIIFKNSELLIKNTDTICLPDYDIANKLFENHYVRDWFLESEKKYTAMLLESDTPTPAGYKWARLRELFATGHESIGIISRALSLLNWRKVSRFCGCCGGPLQDDKYEVARTCSLCGHVFFPHISPAIIILVHKGDKILLAQHAQRNTDVYTCLAGYMEFGETIEECAKREVKEECGIEIDNIRYCASQQWPYPDQLMIALHGDYVKGELYLQEEEIADAKWFSKDDLPNTPKPGSVAYNLIHSII